MVLKDCKRFLQTSHVKDIIVLEAHLVGKILELIIYYVIHFH